MTERSTRKAATSAKTLTIERVFNASPERLWEFWTDPKKFAKWFNPADGMDLVIHEFDPRPGGRTRFDMPQLDGDPNPQEGVFHSLTPHREIISGAPDKSFLIRVTFEPVGTKQTRMTVRVTGVPPEYHEGATKGWNQGFDKLAKLLEAGPAPAAGRTSARKVTIERTFKAPPQTVWAMWTTKEGLEKWYAPEGFEVRVQKLDLRAGGGYQIEMEAVDPQAIEGVKAVGVPTTTVVRATYTEITPMRRLAFRDVADFIPGVAPYEVASLVEFHAVPGGTRVVLVTDAMHNAEWTEMATMGWNNQLDRLVALLDVQGERGPAASAPGGFTIERTFKAPPRKLWEMWTTRAGLEKWWIPPDWTSTVTHLYLRVGGQYEITMKSGGQTIRNHGTYTRIEPMRRLAYTWNYDIFLSPGEKPYDVPISVEFQEVPGGTKVTFTQGPLATREFTEGSRKGVLSNFDKLGKALEL